MEIWLLLRYVFPRHFIDYESCSTENWFKQEFSKISFCKLLLCGLEKDGLTNPEKDNAIQTTRFIQTSYTCQFPSLTWMLTFSSHVSLWLADNRSKLRKITN